MSLPKPKVQAPTPAAPAPVAGAEELRLGGVDEILRSKGAIGRLKLRTSNNPKATA